MTSHITVEIKGEAFYDFQMEGLALNRNQDPADMPAVAARLAGKGHGHDKFMYTIFLAVKIRATRYFWQEWDAYLSPNDGRWGLLPTGKTGQSQSTMNTITKRLLTMDDFAPGTTQAAVDNVNALIPTKDKELIKDNLPEGFLQTRNVVMNYATLREMIIQRRTHGLSAWRYFCQYMLEHVEHPELLEVK